MQFGGGVVRDVMTRNDRMWLSLMLNAFGL
jgi:hypothetical protein